MASYPNINGIEYSYASIRAKINGSVYFDIKSINYDDGLEPGITRGTSTLPQGATAGEWTGTADFEMGRTEGQALIDDLGDGFGRVVFSIVVQYEDDGMDVITDELPAVRIKRVTKSNTQGTDGLVMKFDLHLLRPIKHGGSQIERDLDTSGIASL